MNIFPLIHSKKEENIKFLKKFTNDILFFRFLIISNLYLSDSNRYLIIDITKIR